MIVPVQRRQRRATMKYLQIMKQIQNEISNNHLKRGDRIPSIREMASLFICSKATKKEQYSNMYLPN